METGVNETRDPGAWWSPSHVLFVIAFVDLLLALSNADLLFEVPCQTRPGIRVGDMFAISKEFMELENIFGSLWWWWKVVNKRVVDINLNIY